MQTERQRDREKQKSETEKNTGHIARERSKSDRPGSNSSVYACTGCLEQLRIKRMSHSLTSTHQFIFWRLATSMSRARVVKSPNFDTATYLLPEGIPIYQLPTR
jgi:hypothetical protein